LAVHDIDLRGIFMMHKPIQLRQLSLSFPHKTCFEDFDAQIYSGSRIAIIGRNGSGKSTLLNILRGVGAPTSGQVILPSDLVMGYVPQIVTDFPEQSGGERVNRALTAALSHDPDLLLLDEPTNHLDQRNRQNMIRLLMRFQGTLLMISHDVEILRHCVDTFWRIDQARIEVFKGHFDDYIQSQETLRKSLEQELSSLKRQKKDLHQALMQEQQRAAKSKIKGSKSIGQRKWPTIVSNAKASRSQETSGNKKSNIDRKKQDILSQLEEHHLPEIIVPTFHLETADRHRQWLCISRGAIGYKDQPPIVSEIHLSVGSQSRIAILGDNGSGKSTLIKAILGDVNVVRSGEWSLAKPESMGYLDQHYQTLAAEKTVLETVSDIMNDSILGIRQHLSDFLFRSSEEVNAKVSQLSGGEKARLSLAQIAAKTPGLLILDEITNNLDLETRQHVIAVLKQYPGALIVVSHDTDFLTAIDIQEYYHLEHGCLSAAD
jgi:ATPase subunit of ABC transporter with duplicated ATPase domains